MVQLFGRLITHWVIVPFVGITGLDPAGIYPVLDRMFPETDDWLQAQSDLQIMEAAAVAFFNEERE